VNPLIIDMPSPLGLRPDGAESAPGALWKAGLHARLGSPDEAPIKVPPPATSYAVLRPSGTTAAPKT
jgi:hypothetical protein